MSKPIIYLAGAIHHTSPDFATKWRQDVKEALQERYNFLDPTADKDLNIPGVNETYYTPEQIVTADLDAIDKADIVLVEVSRTDIPYHGTSMEIFYASNSGKTVYVWGGCKSYWVRHFADRIFDNLRDAVEYLCGL